MRVQLVEKCHAHTMVFITRYKSAIKVCFWQWTACHSFSSAQLQVALRAALIKKQQARVPQQVSARWRNWKITSTHYTRERGRRGNSGISDWKRQRVRQSGSRMWVASQHQRLFCHGQPPRTAAFINNSSYRHFTRNALSLLRTAVIIFPANKKEAYSKRL
jgi:hypothetical protein